MGEVSVLASNIEKKIDRLLNLYNKIKDENERLQEENNQIKKEINFQESEIKEFKEQIKLLQIAKSIKSAEGKAEIKLRINELVREIDNCIALLNR